MAKYGTFQYGNSTLYGTGAAAANTTYNGSWLWVLEIAWDGNFTGTNEATGRLIAPVSCTRGKDAYVNRQGTGLEPIYAGQLTFTLDNHDGRYDPYNPSGVLYGKVPQGLQMRLRVARLTAGVPGALYPVFAGYIQDIQPVSGSNLVTVTCSDEIETLSNQDISVDLTFNTTVGMAINQILTKCGITNCQIQSSAHPLTLFSLTDSNAMQELNELTSASLGQFFVSRSGTVTYYDLSYSGMSSHTITQANVLKEFAISQPWDTRRTHIKIAANRWVKTQVKTIWQTSQDVALTAGQTKTWSVEWGGICQPVQLDAQAGDYSLVGLGYLGGGQWLSASISNITASGATVTVTNNGPFPTSTYIRIRGREYVQSYPASAGGYVPWQQWVPSAQKTISTKVTCTAGDDTIPQRKRSYMRVDSRYNHDANYAQAYANLLKTHLENGAKNPIITLQNWADPALMWGIELLDKVHYESAAKSIDNDYYLGKVDWQWDNPNGQDVSVTYHLINHMTSAASITSEGITEINDETGDGTGADGNQGSDGNGVPNLPPETGGECPNDAPANGPYDLGGQGEYWNYGDRRFITGSFSCRARGYATHANYTVVNLTAKAEESTDGGLTWIPAAMPALSCRLMRGVTTVAAATMTGGAAVFAFAGAMSITGVSVEIAEGTQSYRRGDLIASASMAADDADATIILSPAEVGKLYGCQGNGATFQHGEPSGGPSTHIQVMYNDITWVPDLTSPTVRVGGGPSGDPEYPDTYINCHFFYNEATTIYVRANDSDHFYNNTGSIGARLYEAYISGNIRVTVTKFTISNVCPA